MRSTFIRWVSRPAAGWKWGVAPVWATVLAAVLATASPLHAQTCAPASSFVTTPASGVINNFYQGNGNLSVGATSLVLGALRAGGAATPVVAGDLLLVVQMQDASIVSANNNTYGNGSGSGNGSSSVGQSGLHEFVRVVTAAGSNISFSPPLSNNYFQAAATGATAQKTYQVVRVPQYSSLTANGITTVRWNGSTGGVIAVDVLDALTLGSATVEGQTNRAFFAAGKGFRGGGGRDLDASGGASGDYATASTLNYHGSKGEGIAGTPFFATTLTTNWGFRATNTPTLSIPAGTATLEGYPGGSYARGAPANAGGGGTEGSDPGNVNQENAGGGGGGAYGPGGIGGRPWNDPLKDTGGRGGAGYAGTLAFNRVFLGGGGGAGGTNNGTADTAIYTNQASSCGQGVGACSSGAPGGGMIFLRARSIAGTGMVDARGAHGYNVLQDAAGGGGGGGSVVIYTVNGGSASIDVTGGDGGNAWAGNAGGLAGRHGPGGGGGGGFVAFSPSSFSAAALFGGGQPGRTMSNLTPEENYGSTGYNGGLNAFQVPSVPGVPPAALCTPDLSLVKTNGTSSLTSPGTTTYSFTVTNNGSEGSSGTVSVADKLPSGLSVTPGALTLSGANAAAWSCNAANSTDIYCSSTTSIAGGTSSTFAFVTAVSAANGSALTNRARVAGGGDPTKPLAVDAATAVANAAACTANGSPVGCALDTDTVQAPNLSLSKTDGTTTVVRGSTLGYTLTVSNLGAATTTGTVTVVDVLPADLSYSGASPFTVNNFTCTVSGQVISCVRATALGAGSATTITFTALVGATASSSVLNLARVGGGGDPSPAKSTAPTSSTVASCPAPVSPATTSSDPNTGCAADIDAVTYVNLTLSKDDGQPFVSSNGTTNYNFTVQNIGTAASTGVINFRDVLTSTMTISGALGTPFTPAGANGADWSCIRNTSTDVSCTSAVSIPAGASSSFQLTFNIGAAAAGVQQRNRARVGGGGDVTPGKVTSPTNANVVACITDDNPLGCAIDLNTVQTAPEVRLSKSHPNPQARNPGDTFAFTLVLANNGGSAAANNTVRMVDVVPTGLTINSVTPVAPFTCATAGQVVTCNNTAGALPANATRSVVVSVTVGATATNALLNRAKIGATGDPQNSTLPTSVTAALCSGVDVPSFGCAADLVLLNADLRMDKRQRVGGAGAFGDALVGVPLGSNIQYELVVSNAGPALVTGASITDNVPANFTPVSWTCSAAGGASCGSASGNSNTIALTATLPALGTVTILVTASATFTTPIGGVTNSAVVQAPVGITDTSPANNTDSVASVAGATLLGISKTNGLGAVTAGGTSTYTIVVTNSGPTAADGARLYDPVVTGLSCTAAPACVAAGPATSCPAGLTMAQLQNSIAPQGVAIPQLGSGGSVTVTVVCQVTATGQ